MIGIFFWITLHRMLRSFSFMGRHLTITLTFSAISSGFVIFDILLCIIIISGVLCFGIQIGSTGIATLLSIKEIK